MTDEPTTTDDECWHQQALEAWIVADLRERIYPPLCRFLAAVRAQVAEDYYAHMYERNST